MRCRSSFIPNVRAQGAEDAGFHRLLVSVRLSPGSRRDASMDQGGRYSPGICAKIDHVSFKKLISVHFITHLCNIRNVLDGQNYMYPGSHIC